MKPLLMVVFLLIIFPFLSTHAWSASLSLSPSNLTLKPEEQANLTLKLDPQGSAVVGVDVVLTYNPEHLEIISVVNLDTFSGIPKTIISNPTGQTRFSLTENYGVTQLNPAAVATLTLKAKSDEVTTPLTLQFNPGNTRDTNVAVSGGRDVLSYVANSLITIKQLSTTSEPSPSLTPTPIVSPQPTSTGKSPSPFTPAKPTSITSPPTPSPFISPQLTSSPSITPTIPGRILGSTTPTPPTRSGWLIILILYILLILSLACYLLFRLLRKPSHSAQPA